MKILILKNIPGYSAGFTDEVRNDGKLHRYGHIYVPRHLIESGWAEEVKDEIDIDAIRKQYGGRVTHFGAGMVKVYSMNKLTEQEAVFFEAFRVVREIVEILNGEWRHTPDLKGFYPVYIYGNKPHFSPESSVSGYTEAIIPYCENWGGCENLIRICLPELKVLFGVK